VLEEVEGKMLAPVAPEEVEWVEVDESWSYVGKKPACWLWWAIDRATKKVCGGVLGDRGTETAKCLDAQLPHADPIPFYTDCWHPYGIIFEKHRHLQDKATPSS
jgi:IS1 family transposase